MNTLCVSLNLGIHTYMTIESNYCDSYILINFTVCLSGYYNLPLYFSNPLKSMRECGIMSYS